MKTCPFCAEEIQDQTKVCKHCGRDLDGKTTTDPRPVSEQTTGWRAVLTCLILIALGFITLCIALVGARL